MEAEMCRKAHEIAEALEKDEDLIRDSGKKGEDGKGGRKKGTVDTAWELHRCGQCGKGQRTSGSPA
jgi:hypothetical protein